MNKGALVILSGFSGAGKGTIVRRLMEKYPEYVLSVSATTRPPRDGEIEGSHYFFKAKEEFEKMIRKNELLEYAYYAGSGNYYGTPKAFVMDNLNQGNNVILEIEYQGAMDVVKQYADALLVFVTPPSVEELKKRLVSRNTETAEEIQSRFEIAKEEAAMMSKYEFVLVNDDLETAVDDLHKIVSIAKFASKRQEPLIRWIQTTIQDLSL